MASFSTAGPLCRALPRVSASRGVVMMIALVVLLLLSLLAALAVHVGITEQRSAGNTFRAQLSRQLAEGAISHARATLSLLDARIRPNHGDAVDPLLWQRCAAGDLTFPCGVEPNQARRASLYRFIGGIDLNGDGQRTIFEHRSLPLVKMPDGATFYVPTTGASVQANGFPSVYVVGALLCRLPVASVGGTGAPGCVVEADWAADQVTYALVARANLPTESSTATVVTVVSVKPAESRSTSPGDVITTKGHADDRLRVPSDQLSRAKHHASSPGVGSETRNATDDYPLVVDIPGSWTDQYSF